jgi:hypothetical protein
MTNSKLAVSVLLLLLAVSLSCKLFNRKTSRGNGPAVDFVTPGKPLNISVKLDKKQTASKLVPRTGGSVSLSAADGSKFTLDVPADALDADTTITMTAVKSIDGAPLGEGAPTAVQLEPSGLFFKEMATLTIVPAKEIPIKNQIIFGYEGDGKDYHLAVVDPKSKDIKVKLMQFSGAGVGNSDSAWAANLQIQASDASTRISQRLGEAAQTERRGQFVEGAEGSTALRDNAESLLDQFEDQVVLKEMVAAELDCKFAQKAAEDLVRVERLRQLFNIYPGQPFMTKDFNGKLEKLSKIAKECPAPYRIVGGLDDWQTNTEVCNIMKPFTLTGGGFTMQVSGGLSGTYSYTGPFNANGTGTYTISLPDGVGKPGTMTGGGAGSITGDKIYTGSGTEKYTLTPIEPCK